ncbi:phage portal protein [Inquilinus sp.]|jgi:HK97 family phage portal protein|uniref:phage portal protein n=1 Tax=Inquilinus sp. TaxID=1932117 RepID=UPI0037846E36
MKLRHKMATVVKRWLDIKDPEGWPVDRAHAGEAVTDTSALALSAVWACVNLLAGTIASLPLMVYRTLPDGTKQVVKDHPLYRVLHDSPNADQTASDFWEFMAAALELRGNTYARKVKSGDRVIALAPIDPRLPSVRRLPSGSIEYRWTQDGVSYVETEAGVLHIRGFGGDPIGGLSTLHFGRHTFGLAQAADRTAGGMYSNGLRPSGVLTFDKFLTKEQRDELEPLLIEKFTGAMNAGRPMLLEGGSKWEQLSLTPEDAQMLESRAFSIEEICRFFGVPPVMIGHTSKTTSWPTGVEQQGLILQKFTLRRRLNRIEQALEKQLLTAADRAAGLTIEFNIQGLLRGDSAARATFYQSALTNGWMTINEVRALENLPSVAGGDVPRMQSQNVPITEAGQVPAGGNA